MKTKINVIQTIVFLIAAMEFHALEKPFFYWAFGALAALSGLLTILNGFLKWLKRREKRKMFDDPKAPWNLRKDSLND